MQKALPVLACPASPNPSLRLPQLLEADRPVSGPGLQTVTTKMTLAHRLVEVSEADLQTQTTRILPLARQNTCLLI